MESDKRSRSLRPTPKVCGSDVEFGNFFLGADETSSGYEASRAVLRELDGISPRDSFSPRELDDEARDDFYDQDCGRRWSAVNGGCTYIDLNHVEQVTSETRSARDHLAMFHAGLGELRDAVKRVNARLSGRRRVIVLANNSDGTGNSYGSHLNVLISDRLWNRFFNTKLHYLVALASYQVSSMVITGAGKVGSECRTRKADFQISSRADHYQTVTGVQTTHSRPIVNARDERHLGKTDDVRVPGRRLHCIFYDSNLMHTACLAKVGGLQLQLAAMELGILDPSLILEDPVGSVVAISHDVRLRKCVRTLGGKWLTAVEHQLAMLESLRACVEAGDLDEAVPDAQGIFALKLEILDRLGRRDFDALARQLDWVAKQRLIETVLDENPALDWASPECKIVDDFYSKLDDDGIYWALEASGQVDRVVSAAEIERFRHEPPSDTRAWLRAQVLRRLRADELLDVNWDHLRVRPRDGDGETFLIDMPDPLRGTAEELGACIAGAPSLCEFLKRLQRAGYCRRVKSETLHGAGVQMNRWENEP